MADKTKTIDGEDYPASCFLVVPDPDKPSTWSLPVCGPDGKPDHGHMGAAYAALTSDYRGQPYDGPNKSEALAKLKKLYASEKMDWPGDAKSTKSGARNSAADKESLKGIKAHAAAVVDLVHEIEPALKEVDSDPEDPGMSGNEGSKPMKASGATSEDVIVRLDPSLFEGGIKAVADYELDVLAVPFGDAQHRDSDKQYFSPATKTYREKFPNPLTIYYHGFTAAGLNAAPDPNPEEIGSAKFDHTDTRGHWYRISLDKSKEIVTGRVWPSAVKGELRASSGSVSHLVRYDKRTGEIKNWPVAEISLIDTGGKRQPANAYAVALPVIKSMYKAAGISLPDLASEPEVEEETTAVVHSTAQAQEDKLKSSKSKKEIDMTEEEMLALLDKRDAVLAAKAAKDAETARVLALEEENKALKADAAKSRRLPLGDGAPYQAKFAATWKYDNLDAASLALVIDMMRANPRPDGERPGANMIQALALKCATGIKNDEDRVYVQGAMKAAGLSTEKEVVEAAIKAATDPMYSTLSTGGSDWVGTAYSNEIWRIIRENRQIVAKIPSVIIPDGFSSEYFPVESTDPTWYKVAEATASDATLLVPAATVLASQAVTARKQMTIAKMGARVLYTGELVEDSLIPFADQLKLQLQISGGEMLEHVVIDGDTATGATTNINCIGGTPVATDLYLLLDGMRKFGLITNTGNSRSASGGLAINDFIETLWLMGPAGLAAADPKNCLFIVDPNVLKAASLLPEVLTKDVSSAATLENGWLTGIWGIPVFPSWFQHFRSTTNPRKANTAGKVDTTTQANNTTGAILGVRTDQWKLGYKRKMTIEVNRIANADSYEVVALMRWGLLSRDTKYPAAITYNVGV